MSDRNVYVDGRWYGPDYPDNGQPPADKIDSQFLGRKPQNADEEEPVGWAAVTTPEQARQFGGGDAVIVEDTDESRDDTPESDPVGIKAVETEQEAAAFRGEPTGAAGEPKPDADDEPAPKRATRTRK